MRIFNPILRGFNPDPSIVRVGSDYYLATSTFEWFPGVQIHHSRDLGNWKLVQRPLNRKTQLDMLGVDDSCGVWAPCLSYADETFYLVFSNVKNFDGVWKDTPNYLVTANDIYGDWSDPIFLDSSGFDGSLFHDDDGRKWYLSMLLDHRGGKFFGGIILQEYDPENQALVGQVYEIFEGTALGKTEGPHLYKRNGYYYLITAEGGTEYGHAVSLARAKSITGPYEVHPKNPIISTKDDPNWPLQKTGHGDLVEDNRGNWYSVFLTGRPVNGWCTLGRETAIASVEWRDDDWLYLAAEDSRPPMELLIEGSLSQSFEKEQFDDFDSTSLSNHFQTLRIPFDSNMGSLSERPGYLRLFGRESLSSKHVQSLVGRRVQSFDVESMVKVEFAPERFQQMAGLVCFYNTYHYHYLFISADEHGRHIGIITCDKYNFTESDKVTIPPEGPVHLKVHFKKTEIQFSYGLEAEKWHSIGSTLDGSILSDDYVQDSKNRYRAAFTGSFIGMCCQDLTGSGLAADFDWFHYKQLD